MFSILKFKNYNFKFNPEKFSVTQKRRLKIFQAPSDNVYIQDLGFMPRVITGEGVLIGDDLMKEFEIISNLHTEQDSGLLYLPNITPFYCYFNNLEIVGQAGEVILHYKFEFVEDSTQNSKNIKSFKSYYVVKSGETMVEIAMKNNISLDKLKQLNPLYDNLSLKEGDILWLN